MTRLLILVTLPPEVTATYRDRLREAFPAVAIDTAAHASEAAAKIGAAEVLLTFGPMLTDEVVRNARKLRWIQALGTGVDNIVDLRAKRNAGIPDCAALHPGYVGYELPSTSSRSIFSG